MSKHDPAFPRLTDWNPNTGECYSNASEGLSKRELFVAMAMQGLLSNQAMVDGATPQTRKWVASEAVQHANALLEKLEEGK